MEHTLQVVSAKTVGDDRADVMPRSGGYVIVLADGAGGTSGGAAAADTVLATSRERALRTVSDCVDLLCELDLQLANIGQTTAVVVVVHDGQLFGASVGDSSAWLLDASGYEVLTQHQRRKPLLGSASAKPIGFDPFHCTGRLLVGSDGLFKYVPHARIRELASSLALTEIPAALVAAARLGSGALQDDIAVVVVGL